MTPGGEHCQLVKIVGEPMGGFWQVDEAAFNEPVAKLFGTSRNPSQIEAMYLESLRGLSRQYYKIFSFTVRKIFSIVLILSP